MLEDLLDTITKSYYEYLKVLEDVYGIHIECEISMTIEGKKVE